ncbi:MAG: phosphatidylserine decarboxylase family protein [Flavobacteriaceae bacterium]|nr:phosphatidylserine decarboxylase family protein [Flavobacteriaceae bacterium]
MFHKEGFKIIIFNFLMSTSLVISLEILINSENIKSFSQVLILIQFLLILWFFRNPKRNVTTNSEQILSPADGKIVDINKVDEKEFFNDKRIRVSIFLSPLNIHVNRYPVSGEVTYSKHHHGNYIVAWHPKSSEKNERTSVVIKNKKFGEILYRQIAGTVARRIVNYAQKNIHVKQGEDSGFIKFGSRVDLFLPLNTDVKVKVGDKVKGGITIIV